MSYAAASSVSSPSCAGEIANPAVLILQIPPPPKTLPRASRRPRSRLRCLTNGTRPSASWISPSTCPETINQEISSSISRSCPLSRAPRAKSPSSRYTASPLSIILTCAIVSSLHATLLCFSSSFFILQQDLATLSIYVYTFTHIERH